MALTMAASLAAPPQAALSQVQPASLTATPTTTLPVAPSTSPPGTPLTNPAATPLVSPGAAPQAAAGSQLQGTILGINTLQSPPLVQLLTTTGVTSVYIVDPSLLPGLGLRLDVTFTGQWVGTTGFNANQIVYNSLALLPTATPTPYTYSYVNGGYTTNGNGYTYTTNGNVGTVDANGNYGTVDANGNTVDANGNSVDANGNSVDANGNFAIATPTPTLTSGAAGFCGQGESLRLEPVSGAAVVGNAYVLRATVSGANCTGYTLAVAFGAGSVNADARVIPNPIVLDNNNQAIFSYTGTRPGSDVLTAWLDGVPDGVLSKGEPQASMNVSWAASGASASAPTATATPTPTPPASGTPIAGAAVATTPTATATSAAALKKAANKAKPTATPAPTAIRKKGR